MFFELFLTINILFLSVYSNNYGSCKNGDKIKNDYGEYTLISQCGDIYFDKDMKADKTIIICKSSCYYCDILCNSPDECKGIKIFSAAKQTTLGFTDKTSGQYSKIVVGKIETAKYGELKNSGCYDKDFYDSKNEAKRLRIYASAEDALKDADIKVIKVKDVVIRASGKDGKSLKDSKMDISEGSQVSLRCRGNVENCRYIKMTCTTLDKCTCNDYYTGGCNDVDIKVNKVKYLKGYETPTTKVCGSESYDKSLTPKYYGGCTYYISKKNPKPLIVCTNECKYGCTINCYDDDSCKESVILSGAYDTTINVYGKSALEKSKIYIGDLKNDILKKYDTNCNEYEFKGNHGEFKANCYSEGGCKDTYFELNGQFTRGIITADDGKTVKAPNKDRIAKATVKVNYYAKYTPFYLDCGGMSYWNEEENKDAKTNCDTTELKCDYGTCSCFGYCDKAILGYGYLILGNILDTNKDGKISGTNEVLLALVITLSLILAASLIIFSIYYYMTKKKRKKNY